MSQDIADMPGIDAAMERVSAQWCQWNLPRPRLRVVPPLAVVAPLEFNLRLRELKSLTRGLLREGRVPIKSGPYQMAKLKTPLLHPPSLKSFGAAGQIPTHQRRQSLAMKMENQNIDDGEAN